MLKIIVEVWFFLTVINAACRVLLLGFVEYPRPRDDISRPVEAISLLLEAGLAIALYYAIWG